MNTQALSESQYSSEERFNCPVCLEARLDMVYGLCQHRTCSLCLYNPMGVIKPEMINCPICQKPGSFPVEKPHIPEDTIALQGRLGVLACPNAPQCPSHLWMWEIEEHLRECQHQPQRLQLSRRPKAPLKSRRHPVALVRRSPRLDTTETRTVRLRRQAIASRREAQLKKDRFY